ncbi:MAG: sigma-70 family RNA polymerase sigma factor [Acidimicrobiia bacterium]|nr:sigma-70 family RNA polymerase sigma factor [Acidimicrobiia bacterium]
MLSLPTIAPPVPVDPCPTDQLTAVLDREWAVLRYRAAAVAQANAWSVTDRPFGDLDQLLRIAGHWVSRTTETNEVIGRLVVVARTDQLASRVVLQRILPGLMAIVRRRRRFCQDDAFEDLLGLSWLAIRSYDVESRPERVVCNLVRDAAYRAFTAPGRLRSATELATDPGALDDIPASTELTALDELAELLVEAQHAGVPADDLELVRHLVRSGSPDVVARERNVTTRTVRNHRLRATERIRVRCLPAA